MSDPIETLDHPEAEIVPDDTITDDDAHTQGAPPPNGGPQPAGKAGAAPTSSVKTKAKHLHGDLNQAENIVQFEKEVGIVQQFFPGSTRLMRTPFRLNQIWRISEESEADLAKLFVADEAELNHLQDLIERQRVLILCGDLNLGKKTTAIYLGHALRERLARQAANSPASEAAPLATYLIPTLERHSMIDLNELCQNSAKSAGCFLIFQNAFARGNQDLFAFFGQLAKYNLSGLSEKLRANNSYLIFTTYTAEIAHLADKLAEIEISYELKQLSATLLQRGLAQRLTVLAADSRINKQHLAVLEDAQKRDLLIAEAKTMPRIVRVVEYYLHYASETGEVLDLEEAIHRSADIRHWFQNELVLDFDSWCFALALGLTNCLHQSRSVSWSDFEFIRRAVWHCLKRDPELFPGRRTSYDQPAAEPSGRPPVLIDDFFLGSCRAYIRRDDNFGDLIGFTDDSYHAKLWDLLQRHHRRVLDIVFRRLSEVAEDPETDPRRRALCAQIMGRIGEIDPEHMMLPQLNRWIYSGDTRRRATVGALYEGILASTNERYRQYFLQLLKSLPLANNEDKEDEKYRLLTAIAIFARVATYELAIAMNGLKKIVVDKLVPTMKNAHRIEELIERSDREFAKQTSVEGVIALGVLQKRLSDVAKRMYSEQGSTFVGVQYALCSIALTAERSSPEALPGVLRVFRELRRWIEAADRETGALIALMFFFDDGIAATLSANQTGAAAMETKASERKSRGPIVEALSASDEAVVEMARFLVTLYESFTANFTYPHQFTKYLKQSFLSQLTSWVEEALPFDGCRNAMAKLFVELMRIHQKVLFDPLYQLLNDRNFCEKEPRLKKLFVDAVLWSGQGAKALKES